jgi:hypothetical protein
MDARTSAAEAAEAADSKRKKFVSLAEKRTVNAIKAIRVIGKLGNRSHYAYDDADIRKIEKALMREIDALKARLSNTRQKDIVDFKL